MATTAGRWRDDDAVRSWNTLLRAHAAVIPRLERQLQGRAGISLSACDVLLELHAAAGGRLRMQDLGEAIVLSRSRASRIVDELERAGLVRREPHASDRRSSYATLTDAGRRVARRVAPLYAKSVQEHFAAHLTPAQLRTVRDALDRVAAAAG